MHIKQLMLFFLLAAALAGCGGADGANRGNVASNLQIAADAAVTANLRTAPANSGPPGNSLALGLAELRQEHPTSTTLVLALAGITACAALGGLLRSRAPRQTGTAHTPGTPHPVGPGPAQKRPAGVRGEANRRRAEATLIHVDFRGSEGFPVAIGASTDARHTTLGAASARHGHTLHPAGNINPSGDTKNNTRGPHLVQGAAAASSNNKMKATLKETGRTAGIIATTTFIILCLFGVVMPLRAQQAPQQTAAGSGGKTLPNTAWLTNQTVQGIFLKVEGEFNSTFEALDAMKTATNRLVIREKADFILGTIDSWVNDRLPALQKEGDAAVLDHEKEIAQIAELERKAGLSPDTVEEYRRLRTKWAASLDAIRGKLRELNSTKDSFSDLYEKVYEKRDLLERIIQFETTERFREQLASLVNSLKAAHKQLSEAFEMQAKGTPAPRPAATR